MKLTKTGMYYVLPPGENKGGVFAGIYIPNFYKGSKNDD